jgi:hypothetical protein
MLSKAQCQDLIRAEIVNSAYHLDEGRARVLLDRTAARLADLFERWAMEDSDANKGISDVED